MIRINNLDKYYNKGKKSEQCALNDVNLEFGNTGLVCILGESGSGKTTLLNAIGGLDDFSGGSIEINGTKLTGYSPKLTDAIRNEHFGYIFQNYYILKDYTVGYNVKLALNRYDLTEEEKNERVDYILDMLGILKYKKKVVSKLSGGQQQRVSIARALVKAPNIILADEPTGNLDEENTLKTMMILKNISKECLVIVVTHEKRIAKFFADRIIQVSDGKIVSDKVNNATAYERGDDSNIYLKEYEQEIIDDKYIDEVMKYFKKQIAYDVDGNLKEDDNRTVWIKIHMKYNGNTSKNVNMCSGFVVKKDDGKLYPFGVQLFVDREERFTSSKDNSIAYCMDINPGDEYDMWIGFEAPVVNSWTYYLEGSFGYIFQPTGYTGYLIELDIEDRG